MKQQKGEIPQQPRGKNTPSEARVTGQSKTLCDLVQNNAVVDNVKDRMIVCL